MSHISELIGKVFTYVVNDDNNEIIFTCNNGEKYMLYHQQDCCESVYVDDINGDLDDLVGSPITLAKEVSNKAFEAEYEEKMKSDDEDDYYGESHTWTFYKFATVKGYVDIRWFGSSNGYYSESVDFLKADKDGNFDRYYENYTLIE